MTLQNRVGPDGAIRAEPWRGRLMGNRGCLHGPDATLGAARWRTKAWISCRLAFRGRRRHPMPPGRWTALFFSDEAAALAAGHRPCGECRHADHMAFKAAWAAAGLPGARAAAIDAYLHPRRAAVSGLAALPRRAAADLSEGAFVLLETGPALLGFGALHPWVGGAYGAPVAPPRGPLPLLTPEPIVLCLAAGYRPDPLPDIAPR